MKKYFAILTAVLLLFAFSGCTERQTAETTELAINDEAKANNETANVTMEDIVSDMEVCGYKISLPFKAADLPDDFKIDENGSYVQLTDSTGFVMYYKGEEIAYVYCSGKCENNSDTVFTSICFGMFNPVPEINIMGITRDSDYDYVTKKLGTINFSSDKNELRYVFSNSNQVIIHFEDDTQKAINFLGVYYEEE